MWILDPSNAVEPEHPLNNCKFFWGHGVVGGTGRVLNIMPGDINHGQVAGSPGWINTPYGFGVRANSGVSGHFIPIPYLGWVSGSTFGTRSFWYGFWMRPLSYTGPFTAIVDDAARILSSFYSSSGSPGLGFAGFGTLPVGQWYRLVYSVKITGGLVQPLVRAYVNGNRVFGPTGISMGWPQPGLSLGLGANPSTGSSPGLIDYADTVVGVGRDFLDADAALDFEQSSRGYRTPDSPLRWITGVSYFPPIGGGPPPMAGTYLPGFVGIAPGW